MTKTPQRPPPINPPESPMAARLKELQTLIPWAFADGALDVEAIQRLTGAEIVGAEDRYRFQWAGSKECFKALRVPPSGALVPRREDSVDFDNTKNLYIEGDNLEVLKLLQCAYAGRVKMIYIDPPYNTGNDFVYADNFRDPLAQYLQITGQADANGKANNARARKDEKKVNGRKHSKWMAMMFPRLFMARSLLREDGVIFVSIDDNEVHHLRMLMNLVFGEENFVETLIWKKKGGAGNTESYVGDLVEYVVMYSKEKEMLTTGRRLIENVEYPHYDEDGYYRLESLVKTDMGAYQRNTMKFGITNPADGKTIFPPQNKRWIVGEKTMSDLLAANMLHFSSENGGRVKRKAYYTDSDPRNGVFLNLLIDKGSLKTAKDEMECLEFGREIFDTPKPSTLIKHLLTISGDKNAIVMDFFSGSGTTGHAVMQLNAEDGGRRRCISVQMAEPTPEKSEARKAGYDNIAQIGRERLRRAGKQIRESQTGDNKTDTGFRAFALTQSAFRQWHGTPEATAESLIETQMDFVDLVRDDADADALLYEIMLSVACPLTATMGKIKVGGNMVWKITANDAVDSPATHICLDKKVANDLHIQLRLTLHDTLIVRDSALTDSMSTGMAGQCNLKVV